MLRPSILLHVPTSRFRPSKLKSTHIGKRRGGAPKGRFSDVLAIMGPKDSLFQTQISDSNVALLRKCVRIGNHLMGGSIHGRLVKSGGVSELPLTNLVLNMYAKLGLLDECRNLFEEMPERDAVSWSTLISGYASHGFGMEAFLVFKWACRTDPKIDHFVVSSVLKGCSALGSPDLGLQIHGLVSKSGLGFDRYVEVGIVDMYAKCGEMSSAVKVFYEIPIKSLVGWNVMISGYVHNGFLMEAILVFIEMTNAGFIMDLVSLRVVESAASALELAFLCKNLHAYSIKIGLNDDTHTVAKHVRLLAIHGEVDYMKKLFASIKRPDPSLFSFLMSGFNSNHHRTEAVTLAQEILLLGLSLNEGVLVNILKLCSCKEEGNQVHTRIIKTGHLLYTSVSNALVTMYCKLGMVKDASSIFFMMPVRDEISWAAIMAGHVQNLQYEEALEFFYAFKNSGLHLDQYSLATIINACAGIHAINLGKQIHPLILRLGIQFTDFLTASLLHMYSKCGFIEYATRLFSLVPSPRGLVLTNIMLVGFYRNMQPEIAIDLFHREYQMGMAPDEFSFSTALNACASSRSLAMGEQLHCCITKNGLDVLDTLVGNAMMKLYLRSGNIGNMLKFFHGMKRWNSSSYAIMMLGCVQQPGNSWVGEALRNLGRMHQNGWHVNFILLMKILCVCRDLAALNMGRQMHASIIKMGFLPDFHIEEALAKMHITFEEVAKARATIDARSEMPKKIALDAGKPIKIVESFKDVFDFINDLDYDVPVNRRHVIFSRGDEKDPLNLLETMVCKDADPWSTIVSNKLNNFFAQI